MKKQYKSGKPQSTAYKGNPKDPTKAAHKNITHAIPLTLDRYKQAKDPLRKALGIHGSTKISPLMASKFVDHSDPAVRSQAKKIAAQRPDQFDIVSHNKHIGA